MTTNLVRYWLVMPAAGQGTRMHSQHLKYPKQYYHLHGKPVIEYSLRPFLAHESLHKAVVVLNENDRVWSELTVARHPKMMTTLGGRERGESVLNGLISIEDQAQPDDWVLVHDAVRPCVKKNDINALIQKTLDHPVGGILGMPVRDTLKRTVDGSSIECTVNRHHLWHALTPQMFRYHKLRTALSGAIRRGQKITDEASALESMGEYPKLVRTSSWNIKVTYSEDLALVEAILKQDYLYPVEPSGHEV